MQKDVCLWCDPSIKLPRPHLKSDMHAPKIPLLLCLVLSHHSQSEFCHWNLPQQEQSLLAWEEQRVVPDPLSCYRNESVPVSPWKRLFCLGILSRLSAPEEMFFHKPFAWRRHLSFQPLTGDEEEFCWCEIHAKCSRCYKIFNTPTQRDRHTEIPSSSQFLSSLCVLGSSCFRATEWYLLNFNTLFTFSNLPLEELLLMPGFN